MTGWKGQRLNRKQRRARAKKKLATEPDSLARESTLVQAFASALAHHRAGRLDAASKAYRQVLALQPRHAGALNNLGALACQTGNPDEGVEFVGRALAVAPGDALAHCNLGNALRQQGRLDQAAACYRQALAHKPDYPEAHYNLGIALKEQGRLDQAADAYRRALELKPDYAEAHSSLGVALKELGGFDDAVAAYRRALALKPEFPQAHYNLGNALREQGKLDQAVAAYRHALDLKPDYPDALSNLGNAFLLQRKLDPAIARYRRALEIEPGHAMATGQLFKSLQHACRWDEIDAVARALDRCTEAALSTGKQATEDPFVHVSRCLDPARNLAVAESRARQVARRASRHGAQFEFTDPRGGDRRLRIAYLSNEFHDHAIAHLMRGVFGLHDRGAFEVWAYSYGPRRDDPYQTKIRADCDHFVEISALAHAAPARRINADGIDILIDLKGHTSNARLEICAHRPAPVQVTYLGFPGTTGAQFFDYLIADRMVIPEDHLDHYGETVVYMPNCYQVNDRDQPIANTGAGRSDFGIPDQAFAFCSFNQSYKIDAIMFEAWMDLLPELPESVLWLMKNNRHAADNLRERAEALGVAAGRLVFAEHLPKDRHLERLGLADLALDTRIYNGHTTTCDALWAGVPAVTLLGRHFASRVSARILSAIGLPELITRDLDHYRRTALTLGRDRARLRKLREKLWKQRLRAPLFDTERFVRNIEQAYRAMWQRHLAGEAPGRIDIVDEQPSNGKPRRTRIARRAAVETPAQAFPGAVRLHQAGRIDQARNAYRRILAARPAHAGALHYLGVIAYEAGDSDHAIDLIGKALAIDPEDATAHSNLSNALRARGKLDQAVASCRRALDLRVRERIPESEFH